MRISLFFDPHYLWIGVSWNKTPVGWQRSRRTVLYEYSLSICLIPCLPIRLRWDNVQADD